MSVILKWDFITLNILDSLIYVTNILNKKEKEKENVQEKSRLMIDAVRRDKRLNEWIEKLKNFMSQNYKGYYS